MRKFALIISVLFVTVLLANETKAADSIVGCWKMNENFGSYKFNIFAYEDGDVVTELLGELMNGKWEKRSNGTYRITPSSENDYFRAKSETLQSYDNQGLIRTFRRVPCE